MRLKREDYLYNQIQELSEDGQIYLLDKVLGVANKEKLKQKRNDLSKTSELRDFAKQAKEITDNWGGQMGLVSEFSKLNELAGGFRRKGIYIIGGEASSGKSTVAINLAVQFDQQDKRVHIVSYEDPAEFVAARVDKILGGKLDNSRITVPDSKLIEGIYSMDHNKLYEHLAAVKKKQGLDVVVIDYIQFMALFAEEMEYVAINNTMKLFRDIARSLDIVLIALSQLNRGKDVSSNRFHGSSAIEKLADVAVIINRDKDMPSELLLQVVKSKYTYLRQQAVVYKYDTGKEGAELIEYAVRSI